MTETWSELARRITAEERAEEAVNLSLLLGKPASFVLWEARGEAVRRMTITVDARFPHASLGGGVSFEGGR